MKEYIVNPKVTKEKLLKNGFKYHLGDGVYIYKKNVYKKFMSIVIAISQDCNDNFFMTTEFVDDNTGCEYPTWEKYGKNAVLEEMVRRQDGIMKQFVKNGILKAADKKKGKRKYEG